MYIQFFGNYLLEQGYVNQAQLFSAMQKQTEARMKLGTLAIHSGYMTAEEVDAVIVEQTHQDKKFGEIAIESGYLTSEQVLELLKAQSPDFLLLGQTLVDDGVLSYADLENIIVNYKSMNEMLDLDMTIETKEDVRKLFDNFFITSETEISDLGKLYMELLFNNLVRFVGEDFTPLSTDCISEFPVECGSKQAVFGDYSVCSYISMDEATAIEFASRYVGDQFVEYDEYVVASLQDFLNLHNGLFIVNCSNDYSTELSIDAPIQMDNELLAFENKAYYMPVLYSFGTVNFILEFKQNV